MEYFKRYLGDGVYLHHDGYQVWLTTQEGMRIALEPGLIPKLAQYEKEVLKLFEGMQKEKATDAQ